VEIDCYLLWLLGSAARIFAHEVCVNFSISLVVLGRDSSRNREVWSRIFKILSFLVDLKLGTVLGEVKRVLASCSLQIVFNYDLTCVKIWMAQENFE